MRKEHGDERLHEALGATTPAARAAGVGRLEERTAA